MNRIHFNRASALRKAEGISVCVKCCKWSGAVSSKILDKVCAYAELVSKFLLYALCEAILSFSPTLTLVFLFLLLIMA